jgi:serine protease Do
MGRIRWYGPTLVLLVAVLLVMLAGPGLAKRLAHAHRAERMHLVRAELGENPTLAELSNAFRRVAEVVEPSVVHIEVKTRDAVARGGPGMRDMPGDLREWFFGPSQPTPREQVPAPGDEFDRYNPAQPYGNGSGWVYDEQGHIITNNHVVRKRGGELADEILVRFNDGSERQAKVVGTDPRTDVAVIKVEGGHVHPSSIAREPVEQGDIVFAFGSPFRFEFSMSQGIVSGKGRRLNIMGRGGYENFIQTDAAINPGNSGGPLTNIYGQVIGMNTAIATGTGTYNGLGFAIPVDMVVRVADQLINDGRVSRGYLGIFIKDLDPKMAESFGYSGRGVLVEDPIAGGPAVDADIRRGDIITRLDDQAVGSADELRNRVANVKPGSTLKVELFRAGKLITTEVIIGELPDETLAGGATPRTRPSDAAVPSLELLQKLGVQGVKTVEAEDIRQMDLPAGTKGVVVLSVRRGSVAQQQNLARGTVITDVMNEQVTTVDELVEALQKHDLAQGVRISVLERGPAGEWLPRFVLLELAPP